MKYRIENNRLILSADESERAALREMGKEDEFTWESELEFVGDLLANSELDWIHPEETGDMTSAPMLGILDNREIPETELSAHENAIGWRLCGHHNGETFFQPILYRWAFMDYQVRSFLTDLMETGEAVFIS